MLSGTSSLSPELVALGWIERLVRAALFYAPANPAYGMALEKARRHMARALAAGAFTARVSDAGFHVGDGVLPAADGRDALGRRLYMDGIRAITFAPGAEDELATFAAAAREALVPGGQEDLLTALWCAALERISIIYADPALEEAPEPQGSGVGGGGLLEIGSISIIETLSAESSPARPANEDFEETLYFLEPDEVERLQREIEEDFRTDARLSVARGLLDRLADPDGLRATEVLDALRDLVISDLATSDLTLAALVVDELSAAEGVATLPVAAADGITALLDQFSSGDVLGPLVDRLAQRTSGVPAERLARFFVALRPGALEALLRTLARVPPGMRAVLERAVQPLARRSATVTVSLMRSSDPQVAVAAATVAAELGLAEGVAAASDMLRASDGAVRLAAVELLLRFRTSTAASRLATLLHDADARVRIRAIHALGELRYSPVRAAIEERLGGRELARLGANEVAALLDAYMRIARDDGVAFIERILFPKSFALRKPSVEVRAAAARALRLVDTPAARQLLERALKEDAAPIQAMARRALQEVHAA